MAFREINISGKSIFWAFRNNIANSCIRNKKSLFISVTILLKLNIADHFVIFIANDRSF